MHDYDAEVDDLSRDGQIKNTARLHSALDAFIAIDPATLSAGDRDDREMLINSIKGKLLDEAARQVNPTEPIETVLMEIRARHPTVDTLIPTAGDELAGLRAFVLDHHIATIPSDLLPKVEETPGFQRATTAAALDSPGPLEWRATEAFYYVTPPDAGLASDQLEQYLEAYYFPGSRSYQRMRFGRAISCSI